MELFKLAAKEKYRFPFRGNISVEDLFDLTTSQLDVVYKELKSQVKESSDSLLKQFLKIKRLKPCKKNKF